MTAKTWRSSHFGAQAIVSMAGRACGTIIAVTE
jgi:hypothetical protein